MSKSLVDADDARAEWSLVKTLILQQNYPTDDFVTLWKLIATHHKAQFPNLLKLAKLSLHVPLHTADCERGFSCQNRIHTSRRNRLDSSRVNQLMLIQLEGGPSKTFDFGTAVKLWKNKKERKLSTQ